MRIANDTPKLIIDTLQKVDVTQLSKQQIDTWVKQGQDLLKQFPNNTRPLSSVQFKEIGLNHIPQSVGDLLSQINYSTLNFLTRSLAEQTMKKWITKNLPMRG